MDIRESTGSMVPPNSVEAEISVLGAMLQDSSAVLRAAEQLNAEDFYQPEHKEIFRVMAEMNRQQIPIDIVTLQAELARRGSLDGVGGNAYLLKLQHDVPTAANVRSYIDIVLEKSTLRKLIAACQHISKECYSQDRELQDVLTGAEKAIFDIVMNRQGSEELKPLSEVLVITELKQTID